MRLSQRRAYTAASEGRGPWLASPSRPGRVLGVASLCEGLAASIGRTTALCVPRGCESSERPPAETRPSELGDGLAPVLKLTSGGPAQLFVSMLFVVGFGRVFSMTSGVERVSSRYVRMMRRLLVLSALVVFRCFAMVTSSVGHMFLGFLVVLGSFLRHWGFLHHIFGPLE